MTDSSDTQKLKIYTKCPLCCDEFIEEKSIFNYNYFECFKESIHHKPPADVPNYLKFHYQKRVSPSGFNTREIINLFPFSFESNRSNKFSTLYKYENSSGSKSKFYVRHIVMIINKHYLVDDHIVQKINTLIKMM